MEPKPATSPEVREPPAPAKKRKGASKFLAFFSCCSSSGMDADETVPPAKKTVRQAGPDTQPTPEKIDINTGDSSTVEPKEPSYVGEEKNLAVTSDPSQSPVEEERNPGSTQHDSQVAGGVPVASHYESGHGDSSQKHVAEALDAHGLQNAPAATVVIDAGTASETIDDTSLKSAEDFDSTDVAQVTEAGASGPDHAIAAPPSDENGAKEGTTCPASEEEVMRLPANIPPPPPLGPESQVAPHERPLKLLPPALPHLQDRKCLVLDLDETLVHSSFKVCFTLDMENGFG